MRSLAREFLGEDSRTWSDRLRQGLVNLVHLVHLMLHFINLSDFDCTFQSYLP